MKAPPLARDELYTIAFRAGFLVCALTFALASDTARAQPQVYRVGVLMLVKPDRPQLQGLRDGLKEAGFIDGRNLKLDMHPLHTVEELRSRARHFLNSNVNAIVTTGNLETQVAKGIIRELPIIFMPASDPITAGFVKSFTRPGTNLTGIALIRDLDSYGKQLQVFKEAVPSLAKLAVLYDARTATSAYTHGLDHLRKIAPRLSIKIDEHPIREIEEAERIVAALSKSVADGVFVLCSSLFGSGPEALISRARERKLPLFSCGWTQQGALLSYALDLYQVGRRGGWYVSQILNGAKPGDLPVEVPLRYELSINLKTAEAIGMTVPIEVLQRADKVIH